MMPCFERDVSKRTNMSAVLAKLKKMGGHDSIASAMSVTSRRSSFDGVTKKSMVTSSKGSKAGNSKGSKASKASEMASRSSNRMSTALKSHNSDLNMDGVSVWHLTEVLSREASKGVDSKMAADKRAGKTFLDDKKNASIWHMVQA